MEEVSNKKRQLVATLAVLIVIVAIVAAVAVTNKKDIGASEMTNVSATRPAAQTTTGGTPGVPAPNNTATAGTTAPTYQDGTYTATGSYDSPAGVESIAVTVTLASDVVTATSVSSGANDPTAAEYQSMFISGYKQLVVGKNIADISLNRVSGSSLTSQGFNDAIQKIESRAKA